MVHADFIQTVQLLTGLPASYATSLLKTATAVSLADGNVLFKKGDAGDGCYWLQHGILKVTIASNKGEHRILAVLGPGSMIGELAMVDGLPRSATVEALKHSRLLFVSRAAFAKCVQNNPEIYSYIVRTLSARLRQANDETAAASFLTAQCRVARAMLQLVEYLGEDDSSGKTLIAHKVHQADLAAMAGVARENVSRTLSIWIRRNIVAKKSPFFYMVDKPRLVSEAAADD